MLSAAAVMAPAPAAAKSSLEVLLETIKKRDEQPKDAPPALPARPTCRGRLPSARRPSLPSGVKLENGAAKGAVADTVMAGVKLENGAAEGTVADMVMADKKPGVEMKICVQEAKEENVVKTRIFGAKRKFSNGEVLEESPYADNIHKERKEMMVSKELPSVSPRTKTNGKPVFTDTMDYVLQKVRSLFIVI
jgi:myosin-5